MPLYKAVTVTTVAAIVMTVALATLSWLLWTVMGLGRSYFGFLPPSWLTISLFHMIGLFLLFTVLRTLLVGVNIKFGS